MQIIMVEDDVYFFLVGNTREFYEDPSKVLRRLLGMTGRRKARVRRLAGPGRAQHAV